MSCCGGSCGCGDSCNCGSGCSGDFSPFYSNFLELLPAFFSPDLGTVCNMYPGLAEEKITTTQTVILGLVPTKGKLEGFEMAEGSENGCKCGSNCTCDPCNCK